MLWSAEMPFRLDLAKSAAAYIIRDLNALGVSQRQAAEQLGIRKSTFNDFLNANAVKRGNQRRILEKLLMCVAWQKDTQEALEALLHFDHLAMANKLPMMLSKHAAE
jgi:ribosome-binding protein aMBF1 (putative translation factor)